VHNFVIHPTLNIDTTGCADSKISQKPNPASSYSYIYASVMKANALATQLLVQTYVVTIKHKEAIIF